MQGTLRGSLAHAIVASCAAHLPGRTGNVVNEQLEQIGITGDLEALVDVVLTAIRPFFELLGERCQQVEVVAMDMNTAFDLEVKRHCPQAEVVYDLFHVVARYGREVIDRTRVDQANLLRHDKPARQVVKRSRWLLLRNRANLKAEQAVQLQELLEANQSLATAYLLKDALKDIWYVPSVWEGWQRWRDWQRHARDSGLAPLQRFAKNLRRYLRGILASARFPMHTSVL